MCWTLYQPTNRSDDVQLSKIISFFRKAFKNFLKLDLSGDLVSKAMRIARLHSPSEIFAKARCIKAIWNRTKSHKIIRFSFSILFFVLCPPLLLLLLLLLLNQPQDPEGSFQMAVLTAKQLKQLKLSAFRRRILFR